MEITLAFLLMLFAIFIYGGLFVLLLFFVIKRIEDKGREDFEQRDN